MVVTTQGLEAPASGAGGTPRSRRRRPGIGTLAVAIALLPVLVAPVRALLRGWVAISDNGLILMRANDVLTRDHPLLGTWTSASVGAGESINNPGPLYFDLLAPFVKIAGPSIGMAIGVAVANGAAIVLAAWAARRAGGEPALLVVTALSAGLAWSMGSELLFDAWQPHAMLLPFWALLVIAWALGTGDLVMAPVAVGLASIIVQTHLSFVYVTATVLVVGVVGAVWSTRTPSWPAAPPRPRAGGWRRPLAGAAVVAVVAWIQPLIDQLAGEGNLAALARAGRAGGRDTIGLPLGARLVASVVALPPWWGRSGFSETIAHTGPFTPGGAVDVSAGNVASGVAAAFGLLVVATLLCVLMLVGWRRRSRPTVVLATLSAAAVSAALVAAAVTPVTVVGLSPHQLRWLWPIALLVLAAVLYQAVEHQARRFRPVGITAIALLAVVALPMYAAPEGPTRDRGYTATVAALLDQLEGYRPAGPVLYDTSVLRFVEPYSGPTLAALAANGVAVVVADEVTIRQIGRSRAADGTEARRLFQLEGAAAAQTPDGARRVAAADGLDATTRAELETLRQQVIATAGRDGLRLNEAGLDAATAGHIDVSEVVLPSGGDASELEAAGSLVALISNGWVDVAPPDRSAWDRYVDLETQRLNFTVALFEAPIVPG